MDYIVRILKSYMEMCDVQGSAALREYDYELAAYCDERYAMASDALARRYAMLEKRG